MTQQKGTHQCQSDVGTIWLAPQPSKIQIFIAYLLTFATAAENGLQHTWGGAGCRYKLLAALNDSKTAASSWELGMRKSHVPPLHVFTTPAQSRMPRVELPAQSIWNIAFLKGHSLLLFLRSDCLKCFSISYKPLGHFQKLSIDYFFF